MAQIRSESPRYVVPRVAEVATLLTAPIAYVKDSDGMHFPTGSPTGYDLMGSPFAPFPHELARPVFGARAWLDGIAFSPDFPADCDDVFEAISACAVAEPLKVVGQVGGSLAVSGCGSRQDMYLAASQGRMYDPHSSVGYQLDDTNSAGSLPDEDDNAQKKGGKKRNRFCKGKRDRYRKLVERLIMEAQANPATFVLEAANIPQAILSSPELKDKLLATVNKLVTQPAEIDLYYSVQTEILSF